MQHCIPELYFKNAIAPDAPFQAFSNGHGGFTWISGKYITRLLPSRDIARALIIANGNAVYRGAGRALNIRKNSGAPHYHCISNGSGKSGPLANHHATSISRYRFMWCHTWMNLRIVGNFLAKTAEVIMQQRPPVKTVLGAPI